MSVSVDIAPSSTALTTLPVLKEELGIPKTDTDEDVRLVRLITRASREVERVIDRQLALAEVVETLPGTTRLRLPLSRRPVASVLSVTLDGIAVDSTQYSLEDREAGFLFSEYGWAAGMVSVSSIARSFSSQMGELVWSVRYRGGYYMPGFSNLTGSITAATQADPVVITSTGHGLSTGDRQIITGVAGMTELNGRTFTITKVDANTYELDDEDGTEHTAYSANGTWTVTPQLPADLELIAIDLIRARRFAQTRDPSVSSERLGDWSASYKVGPMGLPEEIEQRLKLYASLGSG